MINDFVSFISLWMSDILDWFLTFVDYIFSNPLIATPVAASLLCMIVSVFRSIINSVGKGGSLRE